MILLADEKTGHFRANELVIKDTEIYNLNDILISRQMCNDQRIDHF